MTEDKVILELLKSHSDLVSKNPILELGQKVIVTGLGGPDGYYPYKIGDGVTAYSSLPFGTQTLVKTAADFTSDNPVLLIGQWGYESDTGKVKIGDGSTTWTSLSYFGGSPLGTITEWGGNPDLSDIPSDYLACNGSALLRASYPELNTLMENAGYPWGNGDGSTTFKLPKGEAIIDWSSTSTWTSGASIILNNDMGVAFDEYKGQIFVRDPAIPDKIYNVTDLELYTTISFGQRLNGIDGDLNNCYLQLGSSATNTGEYLSDAGLLGLIPNTWEYKVVLTQKAMSSRSIIKVQ